MAACPRSHIVRRGEQAIYHVWTRTVRQAWLCGFDKHSGTDYRHRRGWIRAFQELLAGLFAIEIAFRAEMSNHLHLVLKAQPEVVPHWSDRDVVVRWLKIKRLVRSADGKTIREITDQEIAYELARPGRVQALRVKLADISEFMKALCEHVARRANKEEGRTGAFFESRFKCRELLDEAAILVCGVYVDLNQVRAGEVPTPETSKHTSVYDRIESRRKRKGVLKQPKSRQLKVAAAQVQTSDGWMSELELDERSEAYRPVTPSASGRRASDRGLLPIKFEEYLQLLDWSGRQVKEGKQGAIPGRLAPILDRLRITPGKWLKLVSEFDRLFTHVVGSAELMARRAAEVGRRWYRGQVMCREAFG